MSEANGTAEGLRRADEEPAAESPAERAERTETANAAEEKRAAEDKGREDARLGRPAPARPTSPQDVTRAMAHQLELAEQEVIRGATADFEAFCNARGVALYAYPVFTPDGRTEAKARFIIARGQPG